MADLHAFIDRVPDEQDRILLHEASRCLEAGARRAAYITIWLATAESLRRKFSEAATFDGQAGQIVGQIQAREAAHKAVDSMLIEKAKDYGFVSDAEATRLRHLYENRNVYGHPYEQSPGEPAVIAAAADAVEIVLERPVSLRHGYLDRQVVRLTADASFLSDDQPAVESYADLVHSRSAADLRVWFIKKMLDRLDAVFGDPSNDLLQRRAVWFLRRFISIEETTLADWEVVDDLSDHPTVLPEILAEKDLFDVLSAHAQDIVVNVLCQATAGDPAYLSHLWQLKENGALADRHIDQLAELIDGTPVRRLTGGGLPFEAYWTRVVAALARHNWDIQNEAISILRLVGPAQVGGIDEASQEEIGRNIMQAADGNAWSAMNFLGEVGSADPAWPAGVIAGVAIEPFLAEDGQIRLRPKRMLRAVRALRAVDEPERNAIIDRITAGLGAGTVRDAYWFRHQREEAIQSLATAAADPGLSRLAEVTDALAAINVPEEQDDDG